MGKGRLKYGKPDANQKQIVSDLLDLGFVTVQDLKAVGGGCPDLLLGISGRNYLVEVKNGDLPPSAQALRQSQVDWHRDWRGSVHVFNNSKDICDWAVSMRSSGIERVPVVGEVLPDGTVLK